MGKVVVVGDVGEAEGVFQLRDVGGVVKEDVVGHVDEFCVGGDAVWWAILADGLVVPPEIPYGFRHPGR